MSKKQEKLTDTEAKTLILLNVVAVYAFTLAHWAAGLGWVIWLLIDRFRIYLESVGKKIK